MNVRNDLCINGLNNGIVHTKQKTFSTFAQKDGTCIVQEGCTDEQVRLSDWSDYCMMC